MVFLAGYVWQTFAPGSFGTDLFLGLGAVLFAISVPWSSTFHKAFVLAALAALGTVIFTGRFDFGAFLQGMPTYFGIVAVLLVLSIAGYPIQAARYEVQIRALMAALTRRGVSIKATAGVLGHVLGAVLDVGAFVLIDVISGRSAPKERLEALKWAGRTFSFAPLWTNLNVLTATTIVLTGVSYPMLLAVMLPFVLVGLGGTLFFAQRAGGEVEEIPQTPLDRGAAAVLLYPVLLVSAVALVNLAFPRLPLTAAIAVTVATIVVLIAVLAAVLTRRASPLARLGKETRDSLTASHSEFALFGAAGILVLSLKALGALAPLGALLSALPTVTRRTRARAHHGCGFRGRHPRHTDGAVAQRRLPARRRTGTGPVGGSTLAGRPVHTFAHTCLERRHHALAAYRAAPAGDRTKAQPGLLPHHRLGLDPLPGTSDAVAPVTAGIGRVPFQYPR